MGGPCGPLWQIYNRWYTVSYSGPCSREQYGIALMPYLGCDYITALLGCCAGHILPLLSSADSLHQSFLTCSTNKHKTHTHIDLFTYSLTHIRTHTRRCTNHLFSSCWRALVVPGCRMSCTCTTLCPLSPEASVSVQTLNQTHTHWEPTKVHAMKDPLYYCDRCKWENAGGVIR